MSWNVWNCPSGSFMVDMGISPNIMKFPSPKCYMTFWDMTIYNDTLNWSGITPIRELITELDFITDFTLLPNFGGFHRTLQRVRLANRGRLLLRTPGCVPFGTCICSNVETILSWTCHVYGPFEFRTSLGTSILLKCYDWRNGFLKWRGWGERGSFFNAEIWPRAHKTQFPKIKFVNQGLDLLNISNIFRDHRATSKILRYFENLDSPLICYQYKRPIFEISSSTTTK